MRENFGIFKGKRVDNGQWVQGNYLHLKGGPVDPDMHFIVTEDGQYNKCFPESVCEYTGVRDKNGVMLFENDVIESKELRLSIRYDSSVAGYCAFDSEHNIPYIIDSDEEGKVPNYTYIGNEYNVPFD